jgi:hypothetical protein
VVGRGKGGLAGAACLPACKVGQPVKCSSAMAGRQADCCHTARLLPVHLWLCRRLPCPRTATARTSLCTTP